MPLRERVPAKLHAELTEYSSLLRALRTNNTLDLALHLSQSDDFANQPQAFSSKPPKPRTRGRANAVVEEGEDERATQPNSEGAQGEEELEQEEPPPKRLRNQHSSWTRWPLLAGEVLVPEWSIYDEVEAIATQVSKWSKTADNVQIQNRSECELDDCPLPDAALQNIAQFSASQLSSVLSNLCAHIPVVTGSMQNRLDAISWKGVLEIVAAGGHIQPEVLDKTRTRLESIFKAETLTGERMRVLVKANKGLTPLDQHHLGEVLTIKLPKEKKAQKRKRGESRCSEPP